MMGGGPRLMHRELSPIFISFLDSFHGPSVFEVFAEWLHVVLQEWVRFSCASTLHFLDIVVIGPAHDHKATKEECKPSLTLIVESIWLIPIWELSHVLVSIVRFVSGLESLTRQLRIDVLLRNVSKSRVGTSMGMRVVEPVQSTGGDRWGTHRHD